MTDLDLKSCFIARSITYIDSQLAVVPASLQLFMGPILNTDKRVDTRGQNFIKAWPADHGQKYCHTKLGLP